MNLPNTTTRKSFLTISDPSTHAPVTPTSYSVVLYKNGVVWTTGVPSITYATIATGVYSYSYALSGASQGDQVTEIPQSLISAVTYYYEPRDIYVDNGILAQTVDGQTVATILKATKAVLGGKCSVADVGSGNHTATFKANDGTTAVVAVTYAADGSRSAVTITP